MIAALRPSGSRAGESPQRRALTIKHIFSVSCRSSVVEHSLGKGEVASSILAGSTRKPHQIPYQSHGAAERPGVWRLPFAPSGLPCAYSATACLGGLYRDLDLADLGFSIGANDAHFRGAILEGRLGDLVQQGAQDVCIAEGVEDPGNVA
jgi:hypothetical protein